MPKTDKAKAKEKAWKNFSLYIRTRDCKEWERKHPEYNGELAGVCVTCGRWFPLKTLQAGHWIAGRNNAVLFSEEGCHAQCYGCNVGKKGNPINYWLYMERTYGREVMDRLIQESTVPVKYSAQDYNDISEKYLAKTRKL